MRRTNVGFGGAGKRPIMLRTPLISYENEAKLGAMGRVIAVSFRVMLTVSMAAQTASDSRAEETVRVRDGGISGALPVGWANVF